MEQDEGPDEIVNEDALGILSVFDRPKANIPRTVYHYTSGEAFLGIITNRKLWLSNAAYLNDPTELEYGIDVVRRALSDYFNPAMPLAEGTAESIPQRFRKNCAQLISTENLLSPWYLGSFSSEGDDISQWRAYCPNGGYAIGFDGLSLAKAIADAGIEFIHGQVEYSKERQLARVEKTMAQYAEKLEERSKSYPHHTYATLAHGVLAQCSLALGMDLLFFKNTPFKAEREWRIGRPTGS
jgi:hypothetical protein